MEFFVKALNECCFTVCCVCTFTALAVIQMGVFQPDFCVTEQSAVVDYPSTLRRVSRPAFCKGSSASHKPRTVFNADPTLCPRYNLMGVFGTHTLGHQVSFAWSIGTSPVAGFCNTRFLGIS